MVHGWTNLPNPPSSRLVLLPLPQENWARFREIRPRMWPRLLMPLRMRDESLKESNQRITEVGSEPWSELNRD